MATFSERIQAGLDDGYGALDGSAWFATFNNINTGNGFTGGNAVGLRFSGVTIPQGAVINSATITLFFSSGGNNNQTLSILGFDEDNTANFTGGNPGGTPVGRTRTTHSVNWSLTGGYAINTSHATPDIATVVQDIISRAGWASGNAMGFIIIDNGSSFSNTWDSFEGNSATCALLSIDYTVTSPSSSLSPSSSVSASRSPSSSLSPSASESPSPSSTPSPSVSPSSSRSPSASFSPSSSISSSPSSSVSPSSSRSPSSSYSPSSSVSPSPAPPFFGMKIAKPGLNVLQVDDPKDLIFSSKYGTLKYYHKEAISISFDASTSDISAKGEYAHNLGYYPYCETYVRVYTGGTPSGNYEYCPFFGSGASVAYAANVKITTDKITVYGEINGVSSSIWHFDFLVFVFKNDLHL